MCLPDGAAWRNGTSAVKYCDSRKAIDALSSQARALGPEALAIIAETRSNTDHCAHATCRLSLRLDEPDEGLVGLGRIPEVVRYASASRSLRPNLPTSPLKQPPASQKQPIHNPLIQMPLRVSRYPASVCSMQHFQHRQRPHHRALAPGQTDAPSRRHIVLRPRQPIRAFAATDTLEDANEGVEVGRRGVVVDGLNGRIRGEVLGIVHGVGFPGCV